MVDVASSSLPSWPVAYGHASEARARTLLASLLRPSQLDQWRTTGTFWVHTTEGWFRLGTLYDIRFRAARWPWVERSICVVTEGFEQRPLPDLWAELTVAVQAVPRVFTAEANFRGEALARTPGADDVLALRAWIDRSKLTYQRLRTRGAQLDAAYLAGDIAHRVARSCRPHWASSYAASAVALINDQIERFPAEREELTTAHRPVFALAERCRAGPAPGQPPRVAS